MDLANSPVDPDTPVLTGEVGAALVCQSYMLTSVSGTGHKAEGAVTQKVCS